MWFGVLVHHFRRRQLQPRPSFSGNHSFGQSGQIYHPQPVHTVIMNGKKVRMLLESWELLVATLVVLAFFLNLTAVNHFPSHQSAGYNYVTPYHTGGTRAGITTFDPQNIPHAGLQISGFHSAPSQMPSDRSGLSAPVAPDVVEKCAIDRIAIRCSRTRWLEHFTTINGNRYEFNSTHSYDNVLSPEANPKANRLS